MKVFQKRRKTFYLKRVRNNSLKTSTSIKKAFVFGNIILVVLTALILVGYWSSSNLLGALAVLGFIAPPLLVLHFLYLLFWSLKRSQWFWLSLVSLVFAVFSFGWFYKFDASTTATPAALTVMSYNVMNFNVWENLPIENAPTKITDFIASEDPDVLCIQEHSRIQYRKLRQYPYRAETTLCHQQNHSGYILQIPYRG